MSNHALREAFSLFLLPLFAVDFSPAGGGKRERRKEDSIEDNKKEFLSRSPGAGWPKLVMYCKFCDFRSL